MIDTLQIARIVPQEYRDPASYTAVGFARWAATGNPEYQRRAVEDVYSQQAIHEARSTLKPTELQQGLHLLIQEYVTNNRPRVSREMRQAKAGLLHIYLQGVPDEQVEARYKLNPREAQGTRADLYAIFKKTYPGFDVLRKAVKLNFSQTNKVNGAQLHNQLTPCETNADAFLSASASNAEAEALCAPCYRKDACLSEALKKNITSGIYGGVTARGRKKMLINMKAQSVAS